MTFKIEEVVKPTIQPSIVEQTKSVQARDSNESVEQPIVWQNVIKFLILHLVAAMGLISILDMSLKTLSFTVTCSVFAKMGVTAGAHRLWSHRSYKARFPLRLFLVVLCTMAGQNSIFVWARDHRVHHKFSETDADPHNSKRGFFFSHIGWLLVRKHPEVIQKGSKIDVSDLEQDKLLMFQHKNYVPLTMIFTFLMPSLIPWYFWGESLWLGYLAAVLRYVLDLHATWLVNSAAHMWGDRPYDINISPSENKAVSILAVGEGYHNYHHTFPQDYSASEWKCSLNLTTRFLDLMALVLLVHDRKCVSEEMLRQRISRTGPLSAKLK